MKTLGWILILVGIALALYLGFWVMFVGGIITIIEQLRSEVIVTSIFAWGIAKIMFCGVIAFLCALPFVFVGRILVD